MKKKKSKGVSSYKKKRTKSKRKPYQKRTKRKQKKSTSKRYNRSKKKTKTKTKSKGGAFSGAPEVVEGTGAFGQPPPLPPANPALQLGELPPAQEFLLGQANPALAPDIQGEIEVGTHVKHNDRVADVVFVGENIVNLKYVDTGDGVENISKDDIKRVTEAEYEAEKARLELLRFREPVYDSNWSDLTQDQRLSAGLLGWDEGQWESGYAPSNYVKWSDLAGDQITAAADLEIYQEIWDELEEKPIEKQNVWGKKEKVIENAPPVETVPKSPDLPEGWTKGISEKDGTPYYINPQGESQWNHPTRSELWTQPQPQPTPWTQFKGIFKDKDYEQFITRSGGELRNLYMSYLNEYFRDLQEGKNIEEIKANYLTFVESYYKEAMQNDKKLIEILNNQ
jgi:hypothetical protein